MCVNSAEAAGFMLRLPTGQMWGKSIYRIVSKIIGEKYGRFHNCY